jgi:pimeloyl-ACP methyl ester carboxylesterase
MGNPRLDAFLLLASQWFRGGLDVALLTLPHHGARTPPGARFSGERFAVPHVARLSEAVREAIYEIRQLVHWLREESGAPVGVIGLSLGGYLAALSAGLCDDLDFAVPIVPPVCIGDLAWRFFTQTRHHRAGGKSALSLPELRQAFRLHSPLAHPLRISKQRVMIVAGRGDRIVPPEHPAALWSHWGEPRIHWFSGSHLTPFGRARMARAILEHIESVEIPAFVDKKRPERAFRPNPRARRFREPHESKVSGPPGPAQSLKPGSPCAARMALGGSGCFIAPFVRF